MILSIKKKQKSILNYLIIIKNIPKIMQDYQTKISSNL